MSGRYRRGVRGVLRVLPRCTCACMHVQKQTAGETSGLLLARRRRINFCHIIKTFTAVGSPTIPPTKPTEPLTNPRWLILPSSLLSLNHLVSMDSNYTQCADWGCKLSAHVTSRCCRRFDNIFFFTSRDGVVLFSPCEIMCARVIMAKCEARNTYCCGNYPSSQFWLLSHFVFNVWLTVCGQVVSTG